MKMLQNNYCDTPFNPVRFVINCKKGSFNFFCILDKILQQDGELFNNAFALKVGKGS
jgi:hypothetical protein